MNIINNKNILAYVLISTFGLVAPIFLSAYLTQLSVLWILMVLAMTWNIQGGQMGYNTFGNIVFFGVGMYVCAGVQIGMYFPLAEWTAGGGEKTFVHETHQYFKGFGVGLFFAALIPLIIAAILGRAILGLRGHYFAICTLGLGVASGEMAGGIELIGAGQGMTTPVFPDVGPLNSRGLFFYYLCFVLAVVTFAVVKWAVQKTRFGLTLNAIRDNEDKAEAMGIDTMKYKTTGWMLSAIFVGLAGALWGSIVGYIDPIEVAFDGRQMGVFMVLMTILGGKGTIWGPVLGATIFHLFKEGFWTLFLGWQYVALGALIVLIVVFFPEGLMGYLRQKKPEWFGEVIDEADRKSQVILK